MLRDVIPRSRRALGNEHHRTLDLRWVDARAIYRDTNSSLGDLHEAVTTLEDVVRTTLRVMGAHHPDFSIYRGCLENARMRLADDESRAADA